MVVDFINRSLGMPIACCFVRQRPPKRAIESRDGRKAYQAILLPFHEAGKAVAAISTQAGHAS
jgi:hypothetical protein